MPQPRRRALLPVPELVFVDQPPNSPRPVAQSLRTTLRLRSSRRRTWAATRHWLAGLLLRALHLAFIAVAGVAGGLYVYRNYLEPKAVSIADAAVPATQGHQDAQGRRTKEETDGSTRGGHSDEASDVVRPN